MNEDTQPATPPGYWPDAKGRLIPEAQVKETDKLQEQTINTIFGFAEALSEQIQRFRLHCEDDVQAYLGILGEEYGIKRGGAKGNITLTSFDGCRKVVVQVQEHLTFGPELQIAKTIIDELLIEWSDGSRDELRAIVAGTFNVEKEGQINRENLFRLRRFEIKDERWLKAMEAIADAIRVDGSKSYMRFYQRQDSQSAWQAITIDMAQTRGKAA